MTNAVEFRLVPGEGGNGVVPFVDGRSLVGLVGAYERERGFDVPGGYGGIVVDQDPGDPRRYLTGEQHPWPGARVPLLGCDCGEWGCWPLFATVTVTGGEVRWDAFEQPHRPDRDYGGFGPFVFDEAAYRAAVDRCADVSRASGEA